jgi:glucokinase
MSKSLTVDLGGTNIRAAIIENGSIVRQVATACQADGSEQEIISQLFSLIDQLIDPEIKMIGFGVPSVVDFYSGTVYDVQNIPSWKEVHLKEIMEKKYGIETRVDNDVNCFVLGEKYFGEGRSFHDIVGITLGTGVGAGIIIDDKIYRGADTGAGELGNLPYLDSNYEQYCSSLWMKRHHVDARELSEKASRRDEQALSLWHEFGEHLGKLLQAILFTYNPQVIIIGGGISKGAAYFEKVMCESLGRDFPYQREVDNTKIVFSQLEDGNLLGASML